MAPSQPFLLHYQCWLSFLQLLASIFMLAAWGLYKSQKDLITFVIGLVVWITIIGNDLFMVYRCPVALNLIFGAPPAYLIVYRAVSDPYPSVSALVVVQIPGIVAIVCSLCLIIISLWPIVARQASLPAKQMWTMNTKDAFRVGVLSSNARSRGLSILGQPCEANSSPKPFLLIVRDTRRFLAHLLFRRVRPVETRIYAFARNSFAVFAIGVLIFRTVTALQQAQNEVGTRTISDSCDLIPYEHRLLILSERLLYDPQWNTSLPTDIDFTISAIWSDPGRVYEQYKKTDCSRIWNKTLRKRILLYYGSTAYQNRSLELFDCSVTFGHRSNEPWPWLFSGGGNMTDSFVYRIEARPATETTGGRLVDTQMPHIWLINQRELNSTDFDRSNVGEIRTHLPAFKLLRGSSIAAEANLVTRRLIQSSIVKDTIFQSKPHKGLMYFFSVQSSVAMLNSSDANVAIATVRPTLNPALMYHRSPSNVIDPDDPLKDVCDFIDDYRTGTIFNVIGSVGGLFALLQAMHMLLFGRPLLWGLTGLCQDNHSVWLTRHLQLG
ncbi:hypothetical protein B0J17DRAFT_659649 [Rhizoctonia solani]|nr:hypothetical protein B0J17DRAFT_659649 [Rhizoctonia solani]